MPPVSIPRLRTLAPDAGGASTATTWPSYTSTNEEDAPWRNV